MTKDDYLHIFRTFWPTEGYAGIVKHLPEWSKPRARNFAARNGIRMEPEAKNRVLQAMCNNSRNTRKREHERPVYPDATPANKLLMGRW